MLFEVDYGLMDVEAYKASGKPLPKYVIADNVEEAVKEAKKHENDNASLRKCDLKLFDGVFVVSKKFKGAS